MRKETFKVFITILLLMSVTCVKGQTSPTEYKIQRGESIESIAKDHGVTVDDIIKANPNADGTFYAGMKIIIPARRNEVKEEVHNNQVADNGVSAMNAPEVANTDDETHKLGDIDFIGESIVSYQEFNGDGGDMFSGGFGFKFGFGAKAWLSETAYIKGLLGYKGRFVGIKKRAGDGSLSTSSVYLPLYAGVKINKMVIEVGPYFDYIVKGEMEIGTGSNKVKAKVKDDKFSAGLALNIGLGCFGVSLGMGLTDFAGMKKCKEFFIGGGWFY